ncbi:FliH/SctL family protein [Mitsuaria sp. GD03876]|uniref:FliH/SctL family protein n=1 Tax=Mitsuaria sp. GD03876 TaxID=2975399 RepID=UPI002447E25D|nr:FliH/SctL family protein [Mitsuaria sp. GD03876]MDH0865338.1 FliH/SctL family protein [Mitsuaria sp. GD03876]
MNPAWIAQRLSLGAVAHRIDGDGDASAVLRRESLETVRSAADLVGAVRRACARRLRASRSREQAWRRHTRDAASRRMAQVEAEIRREALADTARIAGALNAEREQLLADAEALMNRITQEAARRLLLDLPPELVARSSARLLLNEWQSLHAEGEARLRAHPDDLPALDALAASAGWTLTSDPTLTRGHCVLAHPAGSLHASYDDNVRALIAALDAVPSAPPATSSPLQQETPP